MKDGSYTVYTYVIDCWTSDGMRCKNLMGSVSGVDWYVHFSNIIMEGIKKLRPGQNVSFTAEDDEHGRSAAKDVTILEEEN